MQIQFEKCRWSEDSDGLWLSLCMGKDVSRARIKEFVGTVTGRFVAEIKKFRQRRSLDANAYLWVLLDELAHALNTDKDRLYLEVLGRYGVFTHIVVKSCVAERVKDEWRLVKELGEVIINGKTGVQLQCYFGSSRYDSREMARLIDGVVSECHEVGVETMTSDELSLIKARWGQ